MKGICLLILLVCTGAESVIGSIREDIHKISISSEVLRPSDVHATKRHLDSFKESESGLNLSIHTSFGDIEYFELERLSLTCPVHSNVTVRTGGNELQEYNENQCATFATSDYSAVISFGYSGGFHGIVKLQKFNLTSLLQFDYLAENDHSNHPLNSSSSNEERGYFSLVIDEKDLVIEEIGSDELFSCGTEFGNISHINTSGREEDFIPSESKISDDSPGRSLTTVSKWTNCYSNDDLPHVFQVGIAIGSTYSSKYGNSVNSVMEKLSAIFSMVNMLFSRQLNVFFQIADVEIILANDAGSEMWDNAGCNKSIFQQLNDFRDAVRPSTQGLWHLIDACVDDRASGVAYVGTLCGKYSSGITYDGRSTWLTVAHELGHNFGAQHSFEEGRGKTGGIMDYGDKKLDGIYQFNTKYRKDEICSTIESYYATCVAEGSLSVLDEGQTCGNGELDVGEECECEEGKLECECCSSCKLRLQNGVKVACSPFDNSCCESDCTYKPANEDNYCRTVDGEDGFCRNGDCDNPCALWNMEFCGLHPDNGCKFMCLTGNTCNDLENWGYYDNGIKKPINLVSNNTVCEISQGGELGICNVGTCIPVEGAQSDEMNTSNPDSELSFTGFVFAVAFALVVFVLVIRRRKLSQQKPKVETEHENKTFTPHEPRATNRAGTVFINPYFSRHFQRSTGGDKNQSQMLQSKMSTVETTNRMPKFTLFQSRDTSTSIPERPSELSEQAKMSRPPSQFGLSMFTGQRQTFSRPSFFQTRPKAQNVDTADVKNESSRKPVSRFSSSFVFTNPPPRPPRRERVNNDSYRNRTSRFGSSSVFTKTPPRPPRNKKKQDPEKAQHTAQIDNIKPSVAELRKMFERNNI